MNIKITSLIILFTTVLMVNSQTKAQSDERITMENVYFDIVSLPENRQRGEMRISLPNEAGDGKCTRVTCVNSYRFDENLMIRVAGQTSLMELSTLTRLPAQRVYVVVERGQVVTLGFRELEISTNTFSDI